MTISTRLIAAGSLAIALVTGIVATANAQTTIGGEKECTYQKVETTTYYGSYAVIVTTYEKTCVEVLDS